MDHHDFVHVPFVVFRGTRPQEVILFLLVFVSFSFELKSSFEMIHFAFTLSWSSGFMFSKPAMENVDFFIAQLQELQTFRSPWCVKQVS